MINAAAFRTGRAALGSCRHAAAAVSPGMHASRGQPRRGPQPPPPRDEPTAGKLCTPGPAGSASSGRPEAPEPPLSTPAAERPEMGVPPAGERRALRAVRAGWRLRAVSACWPGRLTAGGALSYPDSLLVPPITRALRQCGWPLADAQAKVATSKDPTCPAHRPVVAALAAAWV